MAALAYLPRESIPPPPAPLFLFLFLFTSSHIRYASYRNVLTSDAVAVGIILSLVVFFLFTWYHDRQEQAGKHWAQVEIYRRLPLACLASPW